MMPPLKNQRKKVISENWYCKNENDNNNYIKSLSIRDYSVGTANSHGIAAKNCGAKSHRATKDEKQSDQQSGISARSLLPAGRARPDGRADNQVGDRPE